MRHSLGSIALSLSLAFVAACGGGTPAPGTPAGEGGAAPPAEAGAVWSDSMSKDQQVSFMKNHIVPAMDPVFKKGDAAKYAEFGCKTCHGPAFKTPTAFLPHLTMKDGTLTAFAEDPDVSKFMAGSVVPAMAKAMGMAPYDPATHQGFGCAGCHTVDMK